jgi:D-galactarolactone cycloisomerase
MKLAEIRGYHVSCDLPEPLGNAVASFTSRAALVVELVTEDGLSGWGETQFAELAWPYLERMLAPLLLGRDPLDTEKLWQSMLRAGDSHAALLAISAVDMALWDLKGRASGRSIASLLGGARRERIRAYASGPFMALGDDPYRHFARAADVYAAAGFTALKMRSGAGPEGDATMAIALRRQLGDEFEIALDFNRSYSIDQTHDVAARLEPARPLWIEEPLAPDDLAGYARLAKTLSLPLAAGEACWAEAQFEALLATNALALVQPDLFMCGGITGARRIAAIAERHGVPYVPHVWGTAINFHASLQWAAMLPGAMLDGIELPLFEYEQCGNALIDVCGTPGLNSDGTLSVPDGPGIGIDITPATFAPYIRAAWRLV